MLNSIMTTKLNVFPCSKGAGQEVGKSCVVVNINGKKIMFDCGMHMGYHDRRRYPDFSLISKSGTFDNALTCIVITHLYTLALFNYFICQLLFLVVNVEYYAG